MKIKNQHYIIILFFLAGVFTYKFFKTKTKYEEEPMHFLKVKVEEVKLDSIKMKKNFSGKIISNKSVTLQAEILGKIIFIKEDGSNIKKGELIIKLDDEEAIARIKSTKAQYDNEARKLANMEILFKENCISLDHLNEQKSKTEEAEGRLMEAKSYLNKHYIKAPFNGILGLAQENIGACIKQNSNLITITNMKDPLVEFSLSESELEELGGLENIKKCKFSIFKKDSALPLEAVYFANEINFDQNTNAIKIRLKILDADLFLSNNQNCEISVELGIKENILVIPQSAIIKKFEDFYVFSIQERNKRKIAILKQITIGAQNSNFAEITSQNLKEGEKVITEGNYSLYDGQIVEEEVN